MPTPIIYPQVNGVRYNFSAITFRAPGGVPIPGIVAIDYSQELKGSLVYGTPKQPIGRTPGQLKAECKFTMLQLEYENYIEALCLLNGTPASGFLEVAHDIVVQYQDGFGANLGPLITDVIRGFKLEKPGHARKAGPDANVVDCEGTPMYILENGKAPIGIDPSSVNGFIPG